MAGEAAHGVDLNARRGATGGRRHRRAALQALRARFGSRLSRAGLVIGPYGLGLFTDPQTSSMSPNSAW